MEWEKILLVLIVLGVSATVFFFVQVFYKPSQETILDGVRIIGTKQQFSTLLSRDPVLIEMQLHAGNDTKNTVLTAVTAELASTLAQYNKRNFVYGSVDGNASINCVPQTNFCQDAVVVVRIGACNCMRVHDDRIIVEGTPEFFGNFQNVRVLKGVFGLAVVG